jgi:hypothetical protein
MHLVNKGHQLRNSYICLPCVPSQRSSRQATPHSCMRLPRPAVVGCKILPHRDDPATWALLSCPEYPHPLASDSLGLVSQGYFLSRSPATQLLQPVNLRRQRRLPGDGRPTGRPSCFESGNRRFGLSSLQDDRVPDRMRLN